MPRPVKVGVKKGPAPFRVTPSGNTLTLIAVGSSKLPADYGGGEQGLAHSGASPTRES